MSKKVVFFSPHICNNYIISRPFSDHRSKKVSLQEITFAVWPTYTIYVPSRVTHYNRNSIRQDRKSCQLVFLNFIYKFHPNLKISKNIVYVCKNDSDYVYIEILILNNKVGVQRSIPKLEVRHPPLIANLQKYKLYIIGITILNKFLKKWEPLNKTPFAIYLELVAYFFTRPMNIWQRHWPKVQPLTPFRQGETGNQNQKLQESERTSLEKYFIRF